MIKKNKTILVLAAHPDDEVLGCGGSIAKFVKEKFKVYAVYFTDGVSARINSGLKDKNKSQERKRNSQLAAKVLGIKNCFFLSYPDNQLDKIPLLEIIKKIEFLIKKIKPSMLITHCDDELNIDHQIVHKAAITASRPKPNCLINKILLFETLSSSEWKFSNKKKTFNPNYFIDVGKFIEKKLKAIKCYKKELCKWPHPRSIKGIKNLAMYRGQTVGIKYAEAFYLLRQTV